MAKTQAKKTFLSIEMSEELRQAIRKLADAEGRSSGNYIRMIAAEKAQQAGLLPPTKIVSKKNETAVAQ